VVVDVIGISTRGSHHGGEGAPLAPGGGLVAAVFFNYLLVRCLVVALIPAFEYVY